MATTGNSSQFFGAPKWVTGTTYAEGFVVWAPSDSQYYMRKNGQGGAGSTDPASDSTNWIPTGARAVKSVQRGVASPTVTTITISAVVLAKSSVYVNGYGKDSSGIVQAVTGGYLTATTTITVGGNGGFTGGGNIWWEVVETF